MVESGTNEAGTNDTDKTRYTLERESDLVGQRNARVAEYNEPGPIDRLQKQNYNVSLKFCIEVNRMIHTVEIMDTGEGLNLVRSELLQRIWLGRAKPIADPGLTAVTSQTVDGQGVIILHVQLGYLRMRVWFVVVTELAVSVLGIVENDAYRQVRNRNISPVTKLRPTAIETRGYNPESTYSTARHDNTRQT